MHTISWLWTVTLTPAQTLGVVLIVGALVGSVVYVVRAMHEDFGDWS